MLASPRPARNARLLVARLVLLAACVGLIGQLWRLQTVQGEYYQKAADVNRFRLEPDPAPRGVFYDRQGHLLVRNVPALSVAVVPAYLPEDAAERRTLLSRLARLLDVSLTGPLRELTPPQRVEGGLPAGRDLGVLAATPSQTPLIEIVEAAEPAPYRPVVVKRGITRELAMILEEEHLDWPGVLIQVEPVRDYLYGSLLAHLLGYMGPIPEAQAQAYAAQGYDPNRDRVGLTGLEYSLEANLRGLSGSEVIEVDIAGRETRVVGEPQAAVPGHDVHLTIDLGLQREIERILTAHLKALGKKQAVAIAEVPQTGEILAMVSLPAYDSNLFTGGISSDALSALLNNPNRPLVNQAISGVFAPGSTFKIAVAAAALEEGVITPETRLHCGGILWLPNRFYPEDPSLAQPFYCWIGTKYHSSHGSLNVVSALGQSCDIFFYQVGGGYLRYFEGLGQERLANYAELFGLGARTGIDLPGEARGLVPTPKWKRTNYRESWVTGDTYNMSIGQGFLLVTPLQMLNVAAAVANGGTLYRPQLVREIRDEAGHVVQAFAPDVIRTIPVSAENLAVVRQGMRAVVAGPGATAWNLRVPGVAVAGKTGTAEFFEDRNKDGLADRDSEGHLPTHAWFVAFAPYEAPEIAIVVFVYGGGEGSATAVPIASDILTYYFGQKGTSRQP